MTYILRIVSVLAVLFVCGQSLHADELQDKKLTQRLVNTISGDYDVNDLFFKIKVIDGKAILSGRALSEEDKERAEKIALEIKGIKDVQNNLEVKPLTKDDISTLGTMKERTQAGLSNTVYPDESIGDKDFPTYLEKIELESEKNYNRDLMNMEHSLNKNIRAGYSDREIKMHVEDAIRRAPLRGRADNITVLVQNGYVSLYGTVGNVMDQQTIRDAAASVPGVKGISDSTNLNR
ncbi:MAG: BON domain-containing protein [Candidatus Ancaeobacter aquaticus]|nr:BON domain-containing protein [Candidatus Ancaeobacter aquaticus]